MKNIARRKLTATADIAEIKAQAEALAAVVQKTGVVFAVTHNYTGYPLVRQARDMVKAGELGEINAIRAFYIQGWLRTRLEKDGQKQAGWRTDPKRSGAAGCFGDIGTHAYNLGRFITGLIPDQVSCQLKTFEPGRALDDYGTAVIRYANGALGTVTASQISHGRENDIWIEIDGTKASLEWHQEEPNKMWLRVNGQPHRLYTRDPNAAVPGARRPRRRAGCRAAIPRRSWRRSPTSTPPPTTTWSARAAGQKFDGGQQPLSQRRRRRGRHELHHPVRGQLAAERGVAAAEACAVPLIGNMENKARWPVNAIRATWTNHQIVPAEPVDWPEGSTLLVEPISSSEKIGIDESEWRDDPESIAEWIAWVDTIEPLVLNEEEARRDRSATGPNTGNLTLRRCGNKWAWKTRHDPPLFA